jgi:hypothetical protein
MKIFSLPNKDEEEIGSNYPLDGWRLEPRAVSPNQSSVTTTIWAQVTLVLIQHQIFLVSKSFPAISNLARIFY